LRITWAVACLLAVAVALPAGGCGTVQARMGKAEVTDPSRGEALSAPGTGVEQGADKTASARRPSRAAAAEKSPQKAEPQYRLGPEDVLRISVWESKELTVDATVRPDGQVSFPLIQDVQAEGLTAEELAGIIQRRLTAYVKDPRVSVIVLQVNYPKIYVVGNVARPGTYPLRGDMSILQALSLAGGFNEFAGRRSIRLVRGTGSKQEVRKVNYYNMIRGGGESNYLLMPGDTIVVP
jgi:polysaccharide biosynthesis/export protein